MFAYLDIMRPHNAAMSMLAVFIGWILILGFDPSTFVAPQLLLSIIAVFLISGAGNVINDYLDIEADKLNKPKRPLPSGKINPGVALAYAMMLFLTGIVLAGFVNTITFAIAIANSLVLVIYSFLLQNKIFLGNLSIAYLVGSTFLFGGAATGSLAFLQLPLILMLLSGMATFSREIVKDLEDIEGDKQSFLKRLSNGIGRLAERFGFASDGDIDLKYNKERARIIAAASIFLGVLISPTPFLFGLFGTIYLLALVPADVVFLFAFYLSVKENGKRNYSGISRSIKIGMMIALMAFVLGVIFKGY